MAGYIAAIALVIAKDESDRDVYVYEGAPLPDNITDASIERLLSEGYIESVASEEPAEEVVTIPDGDPTEEWTVKQLKAYAKTLSIDLGGATAKPDILAAIIAASSK